MPILVHIAPENEAKVIRRTGIAPTRWRIDPAGHPECDRVVWAFPLLPSYSLTHSWARELKRGGRSTLAAITFRVRDEELVFARHFTEPAQPITAAQTVGMIRDAEDPRGYEIIIPRRVLPREILRSQILPRAVGWRYWPAAKGAPMRLCDCPVCLPRGEVKARRYRERVIARMRASGIA